MIGSHFLSNPEHECLSSWTLRRKEADYDNCILYVPIKSPCRSYRQGLKIKSNFGCGGSFCQYFTPPLRVPLICDKWKFLSVEAPLVPVIQSLTAGSSTAEYQVASLDQSSPVLNLTHFQNFTNHASYFLMNKDPKQTKAQLRAESGSLVSGRRMKMVLPLHYVQLNMKGWLQQYP